MGTDAARHDRQGPCDTRDIDDSHLTAVALALTLIAWMPSRLMPDDFAALRSLFRS
jgi:hypothetical protein